MPGLQDIARRLMQPFQRTADQLPEAKSGKGLWHRLTGPVTVNIPRDAVAPDGKGLRTRNVQKVVVHTGQHAEVDIGLKMLQAGIGQGMSRSALGDELVISNIAVSKGWLSSTVTFQVKGTDNTGQFMDYRQTLRSPRFLLNRRIRSAMKRLKNNYKNQTFRVELNGLGERVNKVINARRAPEVQGRCFLQSGSISSVGRNMDAQLGVVYEYPSSDSPDAKMTRVTVTDQYRADVGKPSDVLSQVQQFEARKRRQVALQASLDGVTEKLVEKVSGSPYQINEVDPKTQARLSRVTQRSGVDVQVSRSKDADGAAVVRRVNPENMQYLQVDFADMLVAACGKLGVKADGSKVSGTTLILSDMKVEQDAAYTMVSVTPKIRLPDGSEGVVPDDFPLQLRIPRGSGKKQAKKLASYFSNVLQCKAVEVELPHLSEQVNHHLRAKTGRCVLLDSKFPQWGGTKRAALTVKYYPEQGEPVESHSDCGVDVSDGADIQSKIKLYPGTERSKAAMQVVMDSVVEDMARQVSAKKAGSGK